MFEYVELKNFKSFKDTRLSLLDRYNNPKKLVLIYGENGIGKSNIASSFFMLYETLKTMDVRDFMEALLSKNIDDIKYSEEFKSILKTKYKDIEDIIRENKTVNSKEPMHVEFGFNINNKSGRYIIETDDNQYIYEKLEYTINKRRGIYFEITPSGISINEKIFLDKTSYINIQESVVKFWGKHSFLSILLHEVNDKSVQYFKDQISEPFNDVIEFLKSTSCKIKIGSQQERAILGCPKSILGDYINGYVCDLNKEILDKTEKMLTLFLKQTNKNIKKAYYKTQNIDNEIRYKLMVKNKICGELRDIDFSFESTGTQSIVEQLPFMLVSTMGNVSVLDEFDTGMHDVLVQNLITSLYHCINGQMILTTHNTSLMELDIPKDSIYVINETNDGNKEIECILSYDNKISDKNNVRKQYLGGKYSGIPNKSDIDFNELLDILK
mgnify:FL=1